MITNNFWRWKKGIAENEVTWGARTVISPGLVNTSGNGCDMVVDLVWQSAWCTIAPSNYSPYSGVAFVVGSGTTEPSETDYNLANDITSNFSNIAFTKTCVASSDNLESTYVVTGTNSSANTQTISEIGYIKRIFYTQDSATTPVMMARELLSEPLVVEPNQSFEITFVWKEV